MKAHCAVLCCMHSQSHAKLCSAVTALASEVQADEALSARIKHKFKIKNTVRPQQQCMGAGSGNMRALGWQRNSH